LSEQELDNRASALEILGEVYSSIKKEEGLGNDAEYVKIDKK